MKGLCLKCCLALILVSSFFCGSIYAQPVAPDVSVWDNTLWKIKSTSKGYYFSPEAAANNGPPDTKLSVSSSQWGVLSVDPVGFLTMNIYQAGANNACVFIEALSLTYLAGSSFNFMANFEVSLETSLTTGLLRISGKSNEEGTVALKGKLESLGVFNEETSFQEENDFAAFGVTIKGKMVKELGCTIQ